MGWSEDVRNRIDAKIADLIAADADMIADGADPADTVEAIHAMLNEQDPDHVYEWLVW